MEEECIEFTPASCHIQRSKYHIAPVTFRRIFIFMTNHIYNLLKLNEHKKNSSKGAFSANPNLFDIRVSFGWSESKDAPFVFNETLFACNSITFSSFSFLLTFDASLVMHIQQTDASVVLCVLILNRRNEQK